MTEDKRSVQRGSRRKERAPSTAKQSAGVKRPNTRRVAKKKKSTPPIAVPKRLASQLAKVAIGLAAAGGVFFAVQYVRAALSSSDAFRVEAIEVTGLERAEQEAIVELSGVTEGQSLLGMELAEIERAVERHPWVSRAHVSRRFPKTLQIEVREHQPVALVALGNLYYVSSEGEVVKRHAPGENEVFPIITGLDREEVERGDGVALARIRQALAFLDEWRAASGGGSPETAVAIEQVHLDPAAGVSFVPAGEGLRVHLGPPPWREALARYVEVRRELEERGVRASEIALGGQRRPERVTARLSGR